MNAPKSDFISRYLEDFPNLYPLLRGVPSPSSVPIRLHEYPKSRASYERQARSVAERGSAANVVAVLLGQNAVILVERTSEHAGMALPSGSVTTAQNESFLQAFERESREETGIVVPALSAHLIDVEIRRFINMDTDERQHVIVGTVVGRPLGGLAPGLELELTPEAAAEGLRKVGTYALDALPELIFNDEQKIRSAVGHYAIAA